MNILWDGLIQKTRPTGGVSRYCAEAMHYLANQPDVNVMAACPTGAPAFSAQAQNLQQITLRKPDRLNRFRLSRFKPDIFQSSYYGPSLHHGAPVVQFAYDFIDARFPVFKANYSGFASHQKKVLECADQVVAISESTANDVCTYTKTPDSKISIVYPALNSSFTSPLLDSEQKQVVRKQFTHGKPYWLWVGPTEGYKNFRTFLKAFAQTAQKNDLQLVLVGGIQDKPNPDLVDILLNGRVLDRVHSLGKVSDDRLRKLYNASTALVQSSLWEGFGIPLVEALCSGTSLVLSDIPVFHEVAGEAAHYADPYSVDSWVDALSRAESTSLSEEERLRRKADTEARFSASKTFPELMNVYQSL